MSSTVETATEVRPFHVEIPDEQIDDLRRRIEATRWPGRELVDDRSQGIQSRSWWWSNERLLADRGGVR